MEVDQEVEAVTPAVTTTPKVFDMEAAEAEAEAERTVPTPVTDGLEDEVIDLTDEATAEAAEDPAPTVP